MNKIKVLWITNIMLPGLAKYLGQPTPVVGGWMTGLADNLINSNVELTVATFGKEDFYYENIDGINFLSLKTNKNGHYYDSSQEKKWKIAIEKFQICPDLTHIHGTELMFGLAYINAFPKNKCVVSIQGLISVYSNYYLGGLSKKHILKNITLRDILKFDTLFQAQYKFKKRGDQELKYFKYAKSFIGRTDWDKAHVLALNPEAKYFHCNEILRSNFFTNPKWNIELASKNSIFLSQAAYPIKGLHKVLEALGKVKLKYPQIQLRIAGPDILKSNSKLSFLKISNYGKIIKKLIRKNGLQKNVLFLGYLSEKEIIKEFLNARIFICPSSIENSPNSLGEAQILGVPSIASYVGGIPQMVKHGINGLLYQFDETNILKMYIEELLLNDDLCIKLSKNSIETSEARHNAKFNANQNISIYRQLIDNNS